MDSTGGAGQTPRGLSTDGAGQTPRGCLINRSESCDPGQTPQPCDPGQTPQSFPDVPSKPKKQVSFLLAEKLRRQSLTGSLPDLFQVTEDGCFLGQTRARIPPLPQQTSARRAPLPQGSDVFRAVMEDVDDDNDDDNSTDANDSDETHNTPDVQQAWCSCNKKPTKAQFRSKSAAVIYAKVFNLPASTVSVMQNRACPRHQLEDSEFRTRSRSFDLELPSSPRSNYSNNGGTVSSPRMRKTSASNLRGHIQLPVSPLVKSRPGENQENRKKSALSPRVQQASTQRTQT